jgi:hypothetical protein
VVGVWWCPLLVQDVSKANEVAADSTPTEIRKIATPY